MKKTVGPTLLLVAVLAVAIFSLVFMSWDTDSSGPEGTPQEESDQPGMPGEGSGTPVTGDNTMNSTPDARIKLSFDNDEVIVKMYDNPTSRDFLTLLPLTLTFEDYSGTEKISSLPKRLSTEDAPAGSDPSAGDFTYYSPWGNLAIFYNDFGYSGGLVILGTIESGTEKLGEIDGDFTVRIERIE
ncbi:cyclophilin-like fold protein [Methanolacinia paynteri]|uniref:cyclophilin-like fold protein n=1 Tax=Methanolacinia paynteri TaxID=230356 RepID=UPI000A8C2D6C|nr:cyclophilin-like fold protein [Methanolacinia paynteri]